MSKFVLCLILLIGLYNCETYEGVKVYEIQRNVNGLNEVAISVSEGEEFALKFRGNPTTGYTWVLLNAEEVQGPLLGTNFEADGIADYVADSKDKYLVGGAGSFYYKFKAAKVANEAKILRFSYQRTWENNENILPDAVVKITVS